MDAAEDHFTRGARDRDGGPLGIGALELAAPAAAPDQLDEQPEVEAGAPGPSAPPVLRVLAHPK